MYFTIHNLEELKNCSNWDSPNIDKKELLNIWHGRKYFDNLLYLEGLDWIINGKDLI
jgi:hypothetical protein